MATYRLKRKTFANLSTSIGTFLKGGDKYKALKTVGERKKFINEASQLGRDVLTGTAIAGAGAAGYAVGKKSNN